MIYLSEESSILYLMQSFFPLTTKLYRVHHDIHFLGVKPRLCVLYGQQSLEAHALSTNLIAGAKDCDLVVDTKELDVTVPRLRLETYWGDLIFCSIPIPSKIVQSIVAMTP